MRLYKGLDIILAMAQLNSEIVVNAIFAWTLDTFVVVAMSQMKIMGGKIRFEL